MSEAPRPGDLGELAGYPDWLVIVGVVLAAAVVLTPAWLFFPTR